MTIHTCSYYCDRPECIKAQRDELRQRLEQAEKREWVGLAVNEAREFYESNLSRADLINKIDEFLEEKNRATAPVSE